MHRWLFAAFALSFAATASAQGIRALFTNVQSSSSSLLPGGSGVRYSGAVDSLSVSPNGQRWAIGGVVPGTNGYAIVTGQGRSITGSTLVTQTGVSTQTGDGGTWTRVERYFSVNDSGQVAFSATTSAQASNANEAVARWTAGTVVEMAREGGSVPNRPTYMIGFNNDSTMILNNGQVFFRTTGTDSGLNKHSLILTDGSNPALLAVMNEAVVGGPSGSLTISQLSNGRAFITEGGALFYKTSTDNGTGQGGYIGGGAYRAIEGQPYPGSGFSNNISFVHTDFGETTMSRLTGHYMFGGSNSGTPRIDWMSRDGVVIAQTGQSITPGSTEVYTNFSASGSGANTNTFHAGASNNLGDYVVGGSTRVGGVNTFAWVLNGQQVIAREGDQVDLDGDGTLDDAFLGPATGGTASLASAAQLTDDRTFYFSAPLRNAAGASLGRGMFSVQAVPEPTSIAALALGAAALLRRRSR